jgi:hypothetical protein
MDVTTIDQQYQQLQGQGQQTAQALQTLGGKLQAAAQNGDNQAREWLLDLRELALSFREEQNQMSNLLQSLHGFVSSQNQAMGGGQVSGGQFGGSQQGPQATGGFAPGYGSPQQQPAGGGMFGNFLNSTFGRAIETGAGFGIGDDLIKEIF